MLKRAKVRRGTHVIAVGERSMNFQWSQHVTVRDWYGAAHTAVSQTDSPVKITTESHYWFPTEKSKEYSGFYVRKEYVIPQ